MIRRLFILSLIFLFFPMLNSCSESKQNGGASDSVLSRKEVEIVFAHTSTLGNTSTLMDRLEEDFESIHPEVDVRQVVMDDDDYQKFGLLNLFTASSSPDIYFQWGGFLVERDARSEFSRDLTPFIERDRFMKNFIPEGWFGCRYNNGIYLLPHSVSISVVLFYNKEIFNRLSLLPPTTWKEFIYVCKKIRNAGITPIVAGNKDLWMVGNWAAHIASRIVGELEYHRAFSLEDKHPFTGEGWIEALGLIEKLVTIKGFNPGVVSMTEDEAKVDFITGKAAMIPDGNWLVSDIIKMNKNGPELNYGYFNTPAISQGKGDQNSVMAVSGGYAMGNKIRDPDLCWKFLREFFRAERQKAWVREGIFSPVLGTRSDGEVNQVNDMVKLLKRAKKTVSPPDTGYRPTAWTAFYDAVQQILAGNKTARQSLDEAERFIEVFRPRS